MSDDPARFDPQPFFEALADPIRRRILAMLLDADELLRLRSARRARCPAAQGLAASGGAARRGAGAGPARRGLDALPHPSATAGLGAARPDPHEGRDGGRGDHARASVCDPCET